MIKVFRIDRLKHKDTFLEGAGAAKYGGRWNRPGVPVIYSSESRALAVLEILVNVRNVNFMPKDYVMITLEIEADVISIPPQKLPKDWANHQYNTATQSKFGTFVQEYPGLILKVPSVVIPLEYNYLIDPISLKGLIKCTDYSPLKLDERLA